MPLALRCTRPSQVSGSFSANATPEASIAHTVAASHTPLIAIRFMSLLRGVGSSRVGSLQALRSRLSIMPRCLHNLRLDSTKTQRSEIPALACCRRARRTCCAGTGPVARRRLQRRHRSRRSRSRRQPDLRRLPMRFLPAMSARPPAESVMRPSSRPGAARSTPSRCRSPTRRRSSATSTTRSSGTSTRRPRFPGATGSSSCGPMVRTESRRISRSCTRSASTRCSNT